MKDEPRSMRWIPWRSAVAIAGVLLYFAMPFDLIPDALWILGIVDDTAVAALVLRWVIKDFRNHRARRSEAAEISRAREEGK